MKTTINMPRTVLILALMLVAICKLAMGQLSFPTLDVQQFPRGTMLWLAPKEGQAVTEAGFFEQPGIADILGLYDEMVLLKIRQGVGDITHRRYQQFHAGFEVEGAIFNTHEHDGMLMRANGQIAYLPYVEEPALTDADAIHIVQNQLRMLAPVACEGDDYIVPKVDLIYAPTTWETYGAPLEYRLTYRIGMVVLHQYSSTISYIDAHTGEIFRMEEGAMSCVAGSAYTLYHGWQPITTKFYSFLGSHYELRDECRGDRIHTRVDNHQEDSTRFFPHSRCEDLNDGDNLWQSPEQRPAASLHWAAEMYHDYLGVKLSLNGLDGNGVEVKLVYHPYEMREFTSRAWPIWHGSVTTPFNAKWDIDLHEGHFGRGDGIAPWVSLDVVSHELTHAVMDYEYPRMLTGGNEANALNESFADIFSVCSEMYNLPIHDPGRLPNFTFGEDVANGPRRSMSEPWLFNCPRAYNPAAWAPNNTSEPHRYSSVQTYWFYLLAYGSAGKPIEANATVCGIGLDAAAQIAYRAITDYLGVIGAIHQDAQQAAIHAAKDIFGIGSFEATQCENAWAAVGIGNGSNFCNPVEVNALTAKPMLSLFAYPNPASSTLTISFDSPVKESNCSLELWNCLGTKVSSLPLPATMSPGEHFTTFDCENIEAGSYLLIFTSDHAHICKKIIIID